MDREERQEKKKMFLTCLHIPFLHPQTCNYEYKQHYREVTLRQKLWFFVRISFNINHAENYLSRKLCILQLQRSVFYLACLFYVGSDFQEIGKEIF
jgi:hypothetical protein